MSAPTSPYSGTDALPPDPVGPAADGGVPAEVAPVADPVVVPEGTPEVVPEEPRDRRSARRIVVAVLVGLLAFVMLVVFLLPVAAQQRQGHLRDQYAVAASKVGTGKAAFLMQIPAIGLDQVVARGAGPVELRGGPGWRAGSAPVGQGNTVVLGHSTLWSYPFGDLDSLKGGDRIYVRTRDGRVHRYKVTGKPRVVADSRTRVMKATGPTRLTLVTSSGGPFSTKRTVVVAAADGRQPEVPDDQKERLSSTTDLGSFDERPLSGALMLVTGLVVIGVGVLAARELRHRYRPGPVFVAVAPAVALGVVLVLFNLDAFLPITY